MFLNELLREMVSLSAISKLEVYVVVPCSVVIYCFHIVESFAVSTFPSQPSIPSDDEQGQDCEE
jgi:hypothetical protein